MTIYNLCLEINSIVHDDIDFIIIYKNGRSWNLYCILNSDYKFVPEDCDEYKEGYDLFFNEEEIEIMNNIVKADNNAVILDSNYWSDCFTVRHWMECIKGNYGNGHNKLSDFHEYCCVKR